MDCRLILGGELSSPKLAALQKVLQSEFCGAVREVYEHVYETVDISGSPEIRANATAKVSVILTESPNALSMKWTSFFFYNWCTPVLLFFCFFFCFFCFVFFAKLSLKLHYENLQYVGYNCYTYLIYLLGFLPKKTEKHPTSAFFREVNWI